MYFESKLSLTLEEIIHIRCVLTKAEMESLPTDACVKDDVEKRRVCFLCLKTRFGLLGPWGRKCKLCQKTICVRCYSKMKIPTDHLANIPVILLSPGMGFTSNSPSTKRSFNRIPGKIFGSSSKFSDVISFGNIRNINRNEGLDTEISHGTWMIVCHDCRIMLIQIIKNSRLARSSIRNNVISRLTLDVLPVYV